MSEAPRDVEMEEAPKAAAEAEVSRRPARRARELMDRQPPKKKQLRRYGHIPAITMNEEKKEGSEEEAGDDGPPLKEDPKYAKYFKMLSFSLPKHALWRDGKDPTIMDLDPNKLVRSQIKNEDDGRPLKHDLEYSKYVKMLKVGLPIGAVKNSMMRDGKDPAILDLDPNKSVKSQLKKDAEEKSEDDGDGPPLEEDPEYTKYLRMLEMGVPMGAVKNALQRDGRDPSIMDLDRDESVKSQLCRSDKKKRNNSKKKGERIKAKSYRSPVDESEIDGGSLRSRAPRRFSQSEFAGTECGSAFAFPLSESEFAEAEFGRPSQSQGLVARAAAAARAEAAKAAKRNEARNCRSPVDESEWIPLTGAEHVETDSGRPFRLRGRIATLAAAAAAERRERWRERQSGGGGGGNPQED